VGGLLIFVVIAMRIKFITLLLIHFCVLSIRAQIKVEPSGGIRRFQDSLLKSNDTLKQQIPENQPVLAFYDLTIKKGKIQSIALTAQINLKKQSDAILKRALQSRKWNHLGKVNSKQLYRVVFRLGKRYTADSASALDSTVKIQSMEDEEEAEVKISNREAAFPGGQQAFINHVLQHFEYPERCRKKGISGYVMLKFRVEPDGTISKILATEETEACPEFTKEAIRVIKLSEPWLPAVQDGNFTRAYRMLPLRLSMN
jgi:TonB family protein